jgi:hypothetical protein
MKRIYKIALFLLWVLVCLMGLFLCEKLFWQIFIPLGASFIFGVIISADNAVLINDEKMEL